MRDARCARRPDVCGGDRGDRPGIQGFPPVADTLYLILVPRTPPWRHTFAPTDARRAEPGVRRTGAWYEVPSTARYPPRLAAVTRPPCIRRLASSASRIAPSASRTNLHPPD